MTLINLRGFFLSPLHPFLMYFHFYSSTVATDRLLNDKMEEELQQYDVSNKLWCLSTKKNYFDLMYLYCRQKFYHFRTIWLIWMNYLTPNYIFSVNASEMGCEDDGEGGGRRASRPRWFRQGQEDGKEREMREAGTKALVKGQGTEDEWFFLSPTCQGAEAWSKEFIVHSPSPLFIYRSRVISTRELQKVDKQIRNGGS